MKGTGSAMQGGGRKQSTCQGGVEHTKRAQRDVEGDFECQQVRVRGSWEGKFMVGPSLISLIYLITSYWDAHNWGGGVEAVRKYNAQL